MPEQIPNTAEISRLLFKPSMRTEDADIFWQNVFQFQSSRGCCESVVWRKYAPTIQDVHTIGCKKQSDDRAAGKDNSTYFGAITGNAGAIRALKSVRGIKLVIEHVPDEGIFHAHIGFTAGHSKTDRTALKVMLRSAFGVVDEHECPVT